MGRAVDENLRAYWASNLVNRWLGLRLDWLGSALLAVILLSAVFSPGASPGLVGLAITYSMAITGLLNWVVRSATDCETQLSSAERVLAYAALPVEAPAQVPGGAPAQWPSAGAVAFKGAVARYRPGLSPALQGVTMRVPPGAKVGIVGRTGSGKSSLALALFRVLELEAGAIEIDGVDIAGVGLLDLRQALSIVPQDATLFAGTVRSALDPLGLWAEAELSEALRQVNFPAAREFGGPPGSQRRAPLSGPLGGAARAGAHATRTRQRTPRTHYTRSPPPPAPSAPSH
jgi:ABC-type multidrug transport system fused ATPase/permease subunit